MSGRLEHPTRWQRSSSVLWISVISSLGVSACSDLAADSPMGNARISPEALAEAALEAMAESSDSALDALRVSREEYERLLWPVLPDKNHVPFEFVWSVTGPRSRKARREIMQDYGGLPLELVAVDLGTETEEYPEFVLFQEARMTVRRTDTGEEGQIPLMDVLVEMGGGWKFLNFSEDL